MNKNSRSGNIVRSVALFLLVFALVVMIASVVSNYKSNEITTSYDAYPHLVRAVEANPRVFGAVDPDSIVLHPAICTPSGTGQTTCIASAEVLVGEKFYEAQCYHGLNIKPYCRFVSGP